MLYQSSFWQAFLCLYCAGKVRSEGTLLPILTTFFRVKPRCSDRSEKEACTSAFLWSSWCIENLLSFWFVGGKGHSSVGQQCTSSFLPPHVQQIWIWGVLHHSTLILQVYKIIVWSYRPYVLQKITILAWVKAVKRIFSLN